MEIYEKSPDMNLVISYDENLEINSLVGRLLEIYEKSPDMNLVISYDENLEINRQPAGMALRCGATIEF